MATTTSDALRAELVTDRARAAARAGDLDAALRLLRDLDTADAAGPAALDLLARVHAQRGELKESDACWARVQERTDDPAAAEAAAAGRRTVAAIVEGRSPRHPRLRPARIAAVAVPLSVVLAGGLAFVAVDRDDGTSTPDTAQAAAAQLRQRTQQAEALRQRLQAIQEREAKAAAQRGRVLDDAQRRLTMPGVRLHRDGDGLRVVFTKGLFAPNAYELTSSKGRLLDRLGKRLERLPRRDVAVTVVGHAVPDPNGRARGGSAIALTRAQMAAYRLAAASHRPLTAFTIVTADQRDGPHSDDARNRTVTLLITSPARGSE
ncbi:hypothetical protein OHR68_36295 [Spirillospora sp. NBC_00431]